MGRRVETRSLFNVALGQLTCSGSETGNVRFSAFDDGGQTNEDVKSHISALQIFDLIESVSLRLVFVDKKGTDTIGRANGCR